MVLSASVALVLASVCSTGDALRTKRNGARDLDAYSYSQFMEEFGRDVTVGSPEHQMRAGVFEDSLVQIRMQNSNEFRSWTAGVNHFMDWSESERKALHGYKPSRDHHSSLAALQTASTFTTFTNSTLLGSFEADGTAIRDQGNCGSCWAISAAEAVEAQLKVNSGKSLRVSAQALVDCTPNPQHCGGSGGCDGATGELAYRWMKDVGIPLEQDLTYDAQTAACPVGPDAPWPAPQRVRVSGWNHISPNNKAEPLMQALVNYGATVVAVDANNWMDYESGIFDGCGKDAELGHAVLAVGYGENYWKIQNSWGAGWGEHGHIRLIKHQDEDSFCGQDRKPKEGEGCDGGPSEVTVCGTCGILYDPIVPEGVRLESGAGQSGGEETPVPVMSAESTPYQEMKPWRPESPLASLDDMTTVAPAVISGSTGAVPDETNFSPDTKEDNAKTLEAMMRNVEETTTVAPQRSEEQDMKDLMR